MSRPKKGEPGYAEFRERENARQREHRRGWASCGFGVRRAWREAHREEVNAYQRAWHAAHPGYSAAAQRRWREANPERARELQREFRARRKVARVNEWVCGLAEALADYQRRSSAKEATA